MILGTAVEITSTTVVDGGSADSASIVITDPDDTTVVTSTAMTDEGGGVFTYVYQSSTSGEAGTYTARVSAVSGVYTAISEIQFQLRHGEQ